MKTGNEKKLRHDSDKLVYTAIILLQNHLSNHPSREGESAAYRIEQAIVLLQKAQSLEVGATQNDYYELFVMTDIVERLPNLVGMGAMILEGKEIARIVEEIETLRQRVRELDEALKFTSQYADRLADELTTLKKWQGEPVAWLFERTDCDYQEALLPHEVEPDTFEDNPEWYTPLYPAPPTVAAERAISDKLETALENVRTSHKTQHNESEAWDWVDVALAELAAMRKGETE